MNIFSFNVPSLVLLAGGFFSICFLIYRTIVSYLTKRFDFKIFGRLLSFVSLSIATLLLFIGISFQLSLFITGGLLFMHSFAIGLLWSMHIENMNPSLFGRVLQFLVFVYPIILFAVSLITQSASSQTSILIPYAVSILNIFTFSSMFIMFLAIFLFTRINQFDIYATISFLFFAFASIAANFDFNGPITLMFALFVCIAELTITYTWVAYEQRR